MGAKALAAASCAALAIGAYSTPCRQWSRTCCRSQSRPNRARSSASPARHTMIRSLQRLAGLGKAARSFRVPSSVKPLCQPGVRRRATCSAFASPRRDSISASRAVRHHPQGLGQDRCAPGFRGGGDQQASNTRLDRLPRLSRLRGLRWQTPDSLEHVEPVACLSDRLRRGHQPLTRDGSVEFRNGLQCQQTICQGGLVDDPARRDVAVASLPI